MRCGCTGVGQSWPELAHQSELPIRDCRPTFQIKGQATSCKGLPTFNCWSVEVQRRPLALGFGEPKTEHFRGQLRTETCAMFAAETRPLVHGIHLPQRSAHEPCSGMVQTPEPRLHRSALVCPVEAFLRDEALRLALAFVGAEPSTSKTALWPKTFATSATEVPSAALAFKSALRASSDETAAEWPPFTAKCNAVNPFLSAAATPPGAREARNSRADT